MAQIGEVLEFLISKGGYYFVGEEYEGIKFLECQPITKEQFDAGFEQYDVWKAQQDEARATQKAALLDRLGITEDEAKLLLA
jgi:oligoribonuclease NrnB/cAMP/cGMP phosphodiesterase (DHH superfamily)